MNIYRKIQVLIIAALLAFYGCGGASTPRDAGASDAALTDGGDAGFDAGFDAGYDAGSFEITLEWVKQYGGGNSALTTVSDVVLSEKSPYITGVRLAFEESDAGSQPVIVKNLSKLDAEGNTVWSMDVTEPYSNYYDSPEIAIAGSGIIQSSTISSDSEGEKLIGISDLFVRKVSGGGDKDWNSTLGATGSINSSYAVSVAQDGSILVAGRTDHGLGGKSPAGKADGFIVKLDGSGSVEWVTLMGAAGGMVSALSVATDATGNIYAAGYTNVALYDQTLTGKQDAFVIKLTPSGERVWTRLYGAKAGTAQANSITLDLAGAIYVCGSTDMPLNGQKAYGKLDMFLMKTDGAGEPVWTDQMGAFEKATVARAVARYIGGDILLAGSMEGALAGKKPIGKEDAFAARFDSTGKLRWLFNIGAPGVHVSAWSIAADMEGTIYMAANTMGTYDPKQSTSGMDGLLIKITEK